MQVKYIGVDDIHWNINDIMSKSKAFNFAISPREPGKSTSTWRMLYKQFIEKGRRCMVFKRQIADLTETYVEDIATVLNKFLADEDKVKLVYSKGSLKAGVCNVYCYPASSDVNNFNTDEEHLFFRIIALSVPLIRIKSQIVANLEWMLFDEFIPNLRLGEKYLNGEIFKFQEIYNTFQRESKHLRCIFLGNPYSKWNIYFGWLGVDIDKLQIGTLQTGANWAVEFIDLKPELKEYILSKNPLYQFDDSYIKYGLYGIAVNDENIILQSAQPIACKLLYVFRMNSKYLGIFKTPVFDAETDCKYWVSVLKDYTTNRRKCYCFDVGDLVANTHITNSQEHGRFDPLLKSYRWRQIAYKDLEASQMMDAIYDLIN